MKNSYEYRKYLSKESQILLRNFKIIKNNSVIFSGIIPDQLNYTVYCKKFIIYSQKYNIYNILKKIYINILYLIEIFKKKTFFKYNCLVYFWPKDNKEAEFQLTYLLSKLKKNCNVYIIGKKRSGINRIKKLMEHLIIFIKIDFARNCIIYHGILKKEIKIYIKKFLKEYVWNGLIIYNLPGVFGYKGIDQGSLLLISTFNKFIHGKILDLCSGSGILSVALSHFSSNIQLTLIDIYDSALWCSKKHLIKNNILGNVYESDLYSNVLEKFDYIISNPPLHEDLKLTTKIIYNIIKKSKKFLKINGKLRIVTNSMYCYKYIFKKYFKNYCIILKTKNIRFIKVFI
ncbi:16S RNA G1207 methylase [Buchnera aphidicola (Cinara tujafilina)]|uniref:16S RNA G1207 methylase n=1 Tax=Buchnera aphidicola (Cinara tujafilina) TaxID=261317 RepID=F7WZD7_9GAMM|nr:methyltransferase [Buchnera aphidicola]AEH39799.1 16S RNA G1207 methylase [Buchnera aphidicola (Cinara tujafilina)]